MVLNGQPHTLEHVDLIMDMLIDALARNQCLQNLSLTSIDISYAVPSFLTMLRMSTCLKRLTLTFANYSGTVRLSKDQGREVASAFSHNRSIERLALDEVEANLADPLLVACIRHPTVKNLVLYELQGKGQAIRDILDYNETIQNIRISNITVDRETMQFLASGFRRNKTVKKLEFDECAMDASAATPMKDIFLTNEKAWRM